MHEALITVGKLSLAVGSGRADFSDSCFYPHVQKQSHGKRLPAVLQDMQVMVL